VRRDVRPQRHPAPTTGPLDLVWHPGEAQVDFGPADVYVAGRRVRAHYLCLTVPSRNAGYLQLFRGENAECVVHGLVTVCTHLGGAPRRLVFDNAQTDSTQIPKLRPGTTFPPFSSPAGAASRRSRRYSRSLRPAAE
jgi:transposase